MIMWFETTAKPTNSKNDKNNNDKNKQSKTLHIEHFHKKQKKNDKMHAMANKLQREHSRKRKTWSRKINYYSIWPLLWNANATVFLIECVCV